MNIQTIMVVGAGQMGSGIAQVAAQAGFRVILHDIRQEFVDRGRQTIEKNLARSVEKGKMSAEDKEAVLARLTLSVDLTDGRDADFVVEAVTENMGVKAEIFRQLDEICPAHTVLASNTSS
ncbi:MAG: 3-hydroxyacyl-CoA dehydrogenase NAD-binding domain-containing protein, partial [Brevibacillus sp.]